MAKRNRRKLRPSERVQRGPSDAERRENQAQRLARVLRLLELRSIICTATACKNWRKS
jgi:hypothetical protein